MKSKLNRILLLLVALLLTVCLSAAVVSAEESETTGQVNSGMWIHPMEETAATIPSAGAAVDTAVAGADVPEPAYYCSNIEEFYNALRQQLEARNTYFVLGFNSNSTYNWDSYNELLEKEFWEHTGVPTQGDYLYWNSKQISWDSRYRQESGQYKYRTAFTITYRSTADQEQQVDAAVDALLKQLNLDGYSDYAKVRKVYDWMCTNITYDHDGLNAGREICHTTYSAIVLRDTVCQGYASLFYRLMLELDVDCRAIGGDANDYETGPYYPDGVGDNHCWNIVELEGKWYNLDSTWDANAYEGGYGLRHDWFLVNNANFPRHWPWSDIYPTTFWTEHPMSASNYSYTTAPNGWYVKNGKWHYGQNGYDRAGWLQLGGKWYYLDGSGAMKTGWVLDGKNWYYMQADGVMKTGWLQQGSKWYYLNTSGAMVTGTVTINGKPNNFDSSGVWLGEGQGQQNGWVKEGNLWYYYKNGTKATGWQKISGVWYFFNANGSMKTGWLQQGSKWYYLDASGAMVTGTVTIGGKQNKFDANGVWLGEVQQNGWVKTGGIWYYYKNGTKAIGWQKISGAWYYFNANGAMKTGWLQQGSKWYYLDASGAMKTGWLQQGSKWYYFDASGVMASGRKPIGAKTYFFNADGVMQIGWFKYEGEWYYLDSSGAMLMQWQYIGGKIYYFDHNTGKMWHDIWIKTPDGSLYYSCSDGYIYTNGWYWIDGTQHYFDADGVCSNPPRFD